MWKHFCRLIQNLLKIGLTLRKLNFDELPNFVNMIKGEMVFVRPRPALYKQCDLMQLHVANGVHKIKPSITVWAQITGRDEITIETKVVLDKEYLNRKPYFFDLTIIIKKYKRLV